MTAALAAAAKQAEAMPAPGLGRPASVGAVLAGLGPDWRADWAWENYGATVLAIARAHGLRRVCEIGGGRDPLLSAAEARAAGLDWTVNDIDAAELAAGPPGLARLRFDIAGDLGEPGVRGGAFDFVVSRMVLEHVRDVERAWANSHHLLAPGGIAFAFFPTLWAPVFTLNRLLPQNLARRIVQALYPARRDAADDPVFPARYDWCRASRRVLAPMLARARFCDIHVQPFWGHGYYDRMPGLREAGRAASALAAKAGLTVIASHAYVLARKGGRVRRGLYQRRSETAAGTGSAASPQMSPSIR